MNIRKDTEALKTVRAIEDAASTLIQQVARMGDEIDRLKVLLNSWLEFSKDIQAGCAAGEDWLQSLRAQTKKAMK